MGISTKYLLFLCLFLSARLSFSQVSFSIGDSVKTYHIVTLKDGTVLKGKLLKQEKQRIDFQDEIIGNISFRAKEVSSMEKVEPQDHYLITLMNGTTLQGKIVSRKEKEIVVETASIGNVTIEISKIKTIKAITAANFKDGKYWFKTPNDEHYIISPSSIPLDKNEAYYQNTVLIFNGFQFGITNHLSCAGGVVIPFAVFVSPHLGYRLSNNIYAGGGGLFGVRTGNKRYIGLVYGAFTFGNRNAHLTLGGGYGYFNYQRYYYRNVISELYVSSFTISAMKRLSPKYALVTENWVGINNKLSLCMGALRIIGEKHSFDFGFIVPKIDPGITGPNFSVGTLTFMSYMRTL